MPGHDLVAVRRELRLEVLPDRATREFLWNVQRPSGFAAYIHGAIQVDRLGAIDQRVFDLLTDTHVRDQALRAEVDRGTHRVNRSSALTDDPRTPKHATGDALPAERETCDITRAVQQVPPDAMGTDARDERGRVGEHLLRVADEWLRVATRRGVHGVSSHRVEPGGDLRLAQPILAEADQRLSPRVDLVRPAAKDLAVVDVLRVLRVAPSVLDPPVDEHLPLVIRECAHVVVLLVLQELVSGHGRVARERLRGLGCQLADGDLCGGLADVSETERGGVSNFRDDPSARPGVPDRVERVREAAMVKRADLLQRPGERVREVESRHPYVGSVVYRRTDEVPGDASEVDV